MRRHARARRDALRVLLALLLLAPLAAAHVQHPRPSIQPDEETRTVHARAQGSNATFEYLRPSDPPTDHVRHVVDGRRGVIASEYRPQASDGAGGFHTRFVLARVVEYRDQNQDGAYAPGHDPMVRSWSPAGYAWNASGPQVVRVADVSAKLVRLQANASGAPRLLVEAAAAGAAFVDEGATVRPQDLALYVDLASFPRRGTGNLHAIEGVVHPPPGAAVRMQRAQNVTVGILVESPGRLALLDWGGQALVDGQESTLAADLDEPAADGSVTFRIHLPRLDESVRLVMVSGVEYAKEDKRAGAAGAALLVAAAAVAALAGRAFTRAR